MKITTMSRFFFSPFLLFFSALLTPPLLAQSSPNDERIKQTLDQVSRLKEFHPTERSLPDFSWLRRFFEWLGTLYDVARPLFWLLLIVCIVLLVLILVHIIWTVKRVFFPTIGKEEQRAERQRLSAHYKRAAEEAANTGQYTEAVRNFFLALVYRFDENGKLHFHSTRTNREYLSAYVAKQQLLEPLQVFVDTLDDHWYGMQPTPESDYQRCRQLFETLWQKA